MLDGVVGIFPGGFVEVFEMIDEDGNVTPVEPGQGAEGEQPLEEGEQQPGGGGGDAELVAQLQTEIENLRYELEDARKLADQVDEEGKRKFVWV